ncbi:MAG: surface-adhesin E family protein [Syntrophales bacterium]
MDKRIFFSRLYFVLLACSLILPCSKNANGEKWKFYSQGGGFYCFYDAETINYLPNNSVQVFVKVMSEDKQSRTRWITEMRKDDPTYPDNWSYFTALTEVNCKNRTQTLLQLKNYNTTNELINSKKIEHPNPDYISSDSTAEALYKIVCTKQESKKEGQCEGILCW